MFRLSLGTDGASSAGWSLATEAVRAASGMITFLVLARALGAGEYGLYAGATAFVSLALPFASAGAAHVLIARVAGRNESPDLAFGGGFSTVVVGTLLTSVVAVGVGTAVLTEIPASVLIALCVAELAGLAFLELFARLCQSVDDLGAFFRVHLSFSVGRALCASGFWYLGLSSLPTWCLLYAVGSAVSLLVAGRTALRAAGVHFSVMAPSGAKEGVPYAVSLLSAEVQDDIDKTFLVGTGHVHDAGVYAAGYRLIGIAMMPIQAMVNLTYARFFRAGNAEGLQGGLDYTRRVAPVAFTYCAVVVVVGYVTAPAIPIVLGDGFGEVVPIIRLMSVLPAVRVVLYFVGNALAGAGFQRQRSTCLLAMAGVAVICNAVLVPSYGWRGALAATFASEVGGAGLLAWSARRLLRRPTLSGQEGPLSLDVSE